MKKVVVVVVTYNRQKLLKECIEAIKNQSYKNYELLIIDNASTDGTKKMCSKIKDTNIYYYNTGKNLGGAGGFKYGLNESSKHSPDYVLLMDDDTIVTKDTIVEFCEAAKILEDKFSFLGSKVLWTDNKLCEMNKQLFPKNWYDNHELLNNQIIQIKSSSFVSCFINFKYVKEAGLPFSEFFIWCDDVEYTTRLSKYAPGYLVNKSVVIHKCNTNEQARIYKENDINRVKRYKYLYRNRFFNMKKKGIKGLLRYFMLMFRDIVYVILKNNKYKIKKIYLIFCGFIQGLFFFPKVDYIKDCQ